MCFWSLALLWVVLLLHTPVYDKYQNWSMTQVLKVRESSLREFSRHIKVKSLLLCTPRLMGKSSNSYRAKPHLHSRQHTCALLLCTSWWATVMSITIREILILDLIIFWLLWYIHLSMCKINILHWRSRKKIFRFFFSRFWDGFCNTNFSISDFLLSTDKLVKPKNISSFFVQVQKWNGNVYPFSFLRGNFRDCIRVFSPLAFTTASCRWIPQ